MHTLATSSRFVDLAADRCVDMRGIKGEMERRERERESEKKRGRTRASEQRRRKCWLARSGAKRLPEREKGGKSAWSPGFYRLRKCQTPVE